MLGAGTLLTSDRRTNRNPSSVAETMDTSIVAHFPHRYALDGDRRCPRSRRQIALRLAAHRLPVGWVVLCRLGNLAERKDRGPSQRVAGELSNDASRQRKNDVGPKRIVFSRRWSRAGLSVVACKCCRGPPPDQVARAMS